MSAPALVVAPAILPYRGVGSSMVGTILGANKYAKPHQLWAELVGEAPAFEGNLDTKIGTVLEPVIAEQHCQLYGGSLTKGATKEHPEHSWAYATPDYLWTPREGGDPLVLEIKNGRYRSKVGGEHDQRPSYRLQLRWQMLCLGVERGRLFLHFMAARAEERFELIEIERDRDIEAAMLRDCKAFHDCVVNRTPPPEVADV